jgi:CBS domain-containing protein/sporulation protein YlmC with PRC-barrel domain
MVYFSELIGKPIIDKEGKKISRVIDFSFIDGKRYATISGVICNIDGIIKIIKWNNVKEIGNFSEKKSRFLIYLNKEKKKIKFQPLSKPILNDLLDKQIIDTTGARVVRVNDILIGKVGRKLAIIGVDVSAKGLLRRLGVLKFVPQPTENIILWKDVSPITTEIKNIQVKTKSEKINRLHPAEIADMIRDLNLEEKVFVFNSLNKARAAETLIKVQPEIQKTFFKTLSLKKLAQVLETMPSGQAADIITMMPAVNHTKILRLMKPGLADKIRKILSYNKKTAGALMATNFVAVSDELTVKQTVALLKKEVSAPSSIFYVYIKRKDGVLEGILAVRDLIFASPKDKISIFIKRDPIKVNVNDDINTVFNLMSNYGFLALPVVDKENKIIGVIRINDILQIMLPKKIKKQRIAKQD